jgi:octaprenyl-diphosphate synthase
MMQEIDRKFVKRQLKKIPSLRNLYLDIQDDLDQIEEKLKLFTHSPNKIISEISSYLFKNAGKRIRPALVVLCSRIFGYKGDEHILLAALIEAIHTASLIHDDIIDHSDTRRGQDTVHARWGPNISVLLGDYLYIKTLGLSLHSRHREVTQLFTDTSAQMIEGELNEYHMSGNLSLTEEDYLDNINKKTASLFSASCLLGAILGDASKEEKELISGFGTSLGLTFQIIDDLLDYSGDEKTLGKPVLSDLTEGRVTLPLIYTLSRASEDERTHLISLIADSKFQANEREKILSIAKSNGALEYTYQKAVSFGQHSREMLKQLPDTIYRNTLSLMLDYVLTRDR